MIAAAVERSPITGRERVQLALSHQEADHIPFDLAGTWMWKEFSVYNQS